MKIAVISSGHIPSEWAHSINIIKHANGFYKLGHEIIILSPLRHLENKKLKEIGSINKYYNISDEIKFKLFTDRVFYYKEVKLIRRLYKTLERIFFIKDIEENIAGYIKGNNFSFAYCRTYKTPYHLIKLGIPVVIEIHTPRVINSDLKKLLRLSESKYFKGISTISEKIKEEFVNFGVPQEKILVQEDAVDLEEFDKVVDDKEALRKKLNLPLDKKIITYCGSLREGKGIDDLIKVADEFKNNNSILFLIVGGPENKKNFLKNCCIKNNINNICFIGFVQNKFVPQYLKASDILIMLYNRKERGSIMDFDSTSPIKLFEYMAAKVPIIVSDIPTIKKIVKDGENVLLAKEGEVEDVFKKINILLNNKSMGRELTLKAYGLAEKYTYINRCKNIIEKFFI